MNRRWGPALKRLFDVVVASGTLLVLGPMIAVIGAVIKMDSRGPMLFRQTREGLRGEPFTIYKLRTMVHGGPKGQPLSTTHDHRITRIGAHLRRTSLDELPQLFNVIRGDMSLVGPRPQLPGTTRPHERRRLSMRPGMTGLVEVSRPELLTWDERMALDARYVDEWSFRLDLSIIVRTIPVMFSRRNPVEPPREALPGGSTIGHREKDP